MKFTAEAWERAKKIKIIAFDVDGTLTDGQIYMGGNGEMMKAFSCKDGLGISLLRQAGIHTAIITGRKSAIVEQRAAELKIDKVLQGISDKAQAWQDLKSQWLAEESGMDITDEMLAYVGDDFNDVPIFNYAGLRCCPADAHPLIKAQAHVVSAYNGGKGAAREIAEFILKAQEKWSVATAAFLAGMPQGNYAQ